MSIRWYSGIGAHGDFSTAPQSHLPHKFFQEFGLIFSKIRIQRQFVLRDKMVGVSMEGLQSHCIHWPHSRSNFLFIHLVGGMENQKGSNSIHRRSVDDFLLVSFLYYDGTSVVPQHFDCLVRFYTAQVSDYMVCTDCLDLH